MKEAAGDDKSSSGGSGNIRNAAEKERTKMRERQRRSITTKIFHGLRKHGGYPLSPRADINQVLRHLAQEAGWIIEPDGTTYRSSSSTTTTTSNVCPLCGTTRKSGTPTPTSSFMGAMSGGGGGECSTTASPSRITATLDTIRDPANTTTLYNSDHPLVAMYMYGGSGGGGGGGGPQYISAAAGVVNQQGQGLASAPTSYLQLQWTEARASNQNTPAGTPQCRI